MYVGLGAGGVDAAGEDETEQLLCIMEITGLPPSYLVDSAGRRKVFFDSSGNPTIVPNSRGACTYVCVLRARQTGSSAVQSKLGMLQRCWLLQVTQLPDM